VNHWLYQSGLRHRGVDGRQGREKLIGHAGKHRGIRKSMGHRLTFPRKNRSKLIAG